MPAKCLLCGYAREEAMPCEVFHACSWCQAEALLLTPQEAAALVKLEEIQPRFRIWDQGRREDSSGRSILLAEPQPAKLLPGLPLFIGDLDNAADVGHLRELGIGCVVNLCAEKIAPGGGYDMVPSRLAEARINQVILFAEDHRDCDILKVAEQAFGAINNTLRGTEGQNGVLVHCWGGVNRSAAVAVAYLVSQHAVPLYTAVDNAMSRRGTILTNQSFRKQLVQYCFKHGCAFEGVAPAPLMDAVAVADMKSTETDGTLGKCTSPSGGKHLSAGRKDTATYGLLGAARDGCLMCVKDYIEKHGVSATCCSDTRKYTAKDWAEWELDRLGPQANITRKRGLEAVLSYLTQCKDDASTVKG